MDLGLGRDGQRAGEAMWTYSWNHTEGLGHSQSLGTSREGLHKQEFPTPRQCLR